MTTHNDIQKACTDLESDLELAVGAIYGMRHWSIRKDKDGKPELGGHWGGTWSLTEPNIGTCSVSSLVKTTEVHIQDPQELDRHIRKMFVTHPESVVALITARDSSESAWAYRSDDPRGGPGSYHLSGLPGDLYRRCLPGALPDEGLSVEIVVSVPQKPHRATEPACTCGYYAYTSPEALDQNTSVSPGVFGLVKAYGRVTQGTKGFRAEKMEIVGLTTPVEGIISSRASRTEWVPAEDLTLWDDFRALVPETLPVYSNMDELYRAAQPLIEPRFEIPRPGEHFGR